MKVVQNQKHILECNVDFGIELSKIRKTVVLAIFMVRYRGNHFGVHSLNLISSKNDGQHMGK